MPPELSAATSTGLALSWRLPPGRGAPVTACQLQLCPAAELHRLAAAAHNGEAPGNGPSANGSLAANGLGQPDCAAVADSIAAAAEAGPSPEVVDAAFQTVYHGPELAFTGDCVTKTLLMALLGMAVASG